MHRASRSEKVQISGWDILARRTHYPYFKKEEKTLKPSKSFLRYRNDILDVFGYSEPTGNGLKWAKSRKFLECPPWDFKGCLLVHWLFSNLAIGNFIIPYEFFKDIHILCQKTKSSSPILLKAEDKGYWTEKCSSNCPNLSLFVQKWKTVKSGHLMIFLGSQHHIPT